MNKKLDELLADALTPDVQPQGALNEQILRRAKEEAYMKEKKWSRKRVAAAAAIAAAVLVAGTATTYAAWRYITPQEAADELDDGLLADAFAGEDAVIVNEVQTYGDYRATLLGIVSGTSISKYEYSSGGEVRDDRSYWLMAIEHADGTPMPKSGTPEYDELAFLTSPFIEGFNPALYNIWLFGGGYSEFVQDGVLYRMSECDNLELFADREVYLCLADENGAGVIDKAYVYDESTGKIARNESYDGCNALFVLPLDGTKADEKKAEAYLKSLEQTPEEEEAEMQKELEALPDEQREEIESGQAAMAVVEAFTDTLTVENIDELCDMVAGSQAVVDVDWSADWVEYATADAGSSGGMQMKYFRELFPDKAPRISVQSYSISEGGAGDRYAKIEVLRMHEDGTITCAYYVPKNLELQ